MGHVERNDVIPKWIRKTDSFMERAFDEVAKGASLVPCPCSKCANKKKKQSESRLEGVNRRNMKIINLSTTTSRG
jgi:hypothetical protein